MKLPAIDESAGTYDDQQTIINELITAFAVDDHRLRNIVTNKIIETFKALGLPPHKE